MWNFFCETFKGDSDVGLVIKSNHGKGTKIDSEITRTTFKKVINEYLPNQYTTDALYRIVEIYYILGMEDEAKRVAAVLGYNYPESEWYDKSYKILGDIDIDKYDNDSWAGKLFNKVLSIQSDAILYSLNDDSSIPP